MFYKTLNINGRNYPIAVNIIGEGEPDATGALPGMIYFDELHKVAYVYTQNGSWEILFGSQLYLHTLAFNQQISSPDTELFDTVYLYVITTDSTPAEFYEDGSYGACGDLRMKFAYSQIIAAYGGWGLETRNYYVPVELCINHDLGIMNIDKGTYIEQAVIPQMTVRCGDFEDGIVSEVVLDGTKFLGDTVTKI